MIDVRAVTRRDEVEAVIEMARALVGESPEHGGTEFCEKRMREQYRVREQANVEWFVAERIFGDWSELIGYAIFGLGSEYCEPSRPRYAVDISVYVKPMHRGTLAAKKMLQRGESWAAGRGAEEMLLGISTGIRAQRTEHFYERLGYRRRSVSLSRRLPVPVMASVNATV